MIQMRYLVILIYTCTLVNSNVHVMSPLILTPLIEAGNIKEAKRLSKVHLSEISCSKLTSYSGYFTVDKNYDSNLFFWYFPSEHNADIDPVILWLQGGPGWSSLNGIFNENGPFIVDSNGTLSKRTTYWSKTHSMLYIDQPVGTGFSFTNGGYAANQTIISKHIYSALIQFFQMFPELKSNSFYIAGESYAGKYVPSLGYEILKRNNDPTQKLYIDLKGLLIGNALVDPENQLVHSQYLYQLGLIDLNSKIEFQQYENYIIRNIQAKNYLQASNILNKYLIGYTQQPLILNITGLSSMYNYLPTNEVSNTWIDFIQQQNIRKTIHVGEVQLGDKKIVEQYLWLDIPQSQANALSELLSHYKVMLYTGQLDIILAYPTTENYLLKLNFSGTNEYKNASNKIWKIQNNVAGYIKTGGNLTRILVRNAGHMVPADQPEWCYELIYKFVRNIL